MQKLYAGDRSACTPRSFHDTHKVYSRLEAMKVAKEQAGDKQTAIRCLAWNKQVMLLFISSGSCLLTHCVRWRSNGTFLEGHLFCRGPHKMVAFLLFFFFFFLEKTTKRKGSPQKKGKSRSWFFGQLTTCLGSAAARRWCVRRLRTTPRTAVRSRARVCRGHVAGRRFRGGLNWVFRLLKNMLYLVPLSVLKGILYRTCY